MPLTPQHEKIAATAATSASAAAKAAAGASEDGYFDAVRPHLSTAIGAGIDSVVDARPTDPVGHLASWLATAAGTSGGGSGGSASDAAASKRQKQEIKELKSSQKLLEEDNEVMKGMVDDLQKEVDRLQSELTAAKAALKQRPAAKPAKANEIEAFTMSDDDDD